MIKNFTLLLLLIATFSLNAQNINIPDANFKQALLDNNEINTNGNGEISKKEAIAFTGTISVSYKGIKDLTGIECFINILQLGCHGNQLTSLDLSENTAIISLGCSKNQLTSLNLVKNTKITYLNCNDNLLTDLDLSNNTALTTLWCNQNELSSLNVDKNTAITKLICDYNQLSSLNVDQNTAITKLVCDHNQINSLNLDKNTVIEELDCSSNQLSNLDVSYNTTLKLLFCYGNTLTSLDVSNNTSITELTCYDNLLSSLNLTNNTLLSKLYCNENKIPFSELQKIKKNYINLSYNSSKKIFLPIDESDGFTLDYSAEVLLDDIETTFNWYDWNNNIVGDDVIKKINPGVFKFLQAGFFYCKMTNETFPDRELTTENISINNQAINIPDANFKKILVNSSYININGDDEISESEAATGASINVYNSEISDLAGIEYFINAWYLNCRSNQIISLDLSNNTKLTELYCSDNQLTNLNIGNNTELIKINCRNNKLESLNVSQNTEIEILNCSLNQINNLDLNNNTKLTELDCSDNRLTHLNLGVNTEILELNCYRNQLTSIDLSNNTKITDLDCAYNMLTKIDLSKNAEITILECNSNELANINISKSIKITSLKCSSNQLTDIDISNNTLLTDLNINSNQLTNLDLSKNTSITSVLCAYNQLTNLDISKNTILTFLDCYNNKIIFSELQKVKKYYSKLNYTSNNKIFSFIEKPEGYQTDYSSEVLIDNNTSSFTWYNQNNQEVNNEYVNEESNGIFKFLKAGTYYCKMTNATFPGLTLITNNITIYDQSPIAIPDVNFKKVLIENAQINLDGDADISKYEASKFEDELKVSNKNITDLTGIECFINITKLSCDSNQLNSLNTSKNTELTELNCSDNLLNDLNISLNNKLKILDCSLNQLSSLNVSGNSLLTNLNCDQNRLSFSELAKIKTYHPTLIPSKQIKVFPLVEEYVGFEIDYSDEAIFKGNETLTRWFKNSESDEVDENTVRKLSPGLYQFLKSGVYRCEMTNQTFPGTTIATEGITINGKIQSITFENLATTVKMYDVLEMQAIASSGLQVSFELVSGDASINGNSITFNNVGTVIIKAIQEGNDEYTATEETIEIQVDIATGIEDVLESTTQIYPNPVLSEMLIKFTSSEERTIRIFDLHGRLKLEKETSSSSERLNISDFRSGMYLMKVQSANDSFTYKIIKK